jgi:hypothetical protein
MPPYAVGVVEELSGLCPIVPQRIYASGMTKKLFGIGQLSGDLAKMAESFWYPKVLAVRAQATSSKNAMNNLDSLQFCGIASEGW